MTLGFFGKEDVDWTLCPLVEGVPHPTDVSDGETIVPFGLDVEREWNEKEGFGSIAGSIGSCLVGFDLLHERIEVGLV